MSRDEEEAMSSPPMEETEQQRRIRQLQTIEAEQRAKDVIIHFQQDGVKRFSITSKTTAPFHIISRFHKAYLNAEGAKEMNEVLDRIAVSIKNYWEGQTELAHDMLMCAKWSNQANHINLYFE